MKKIKFKDDIQDWENKVLKDIYTFAYSGGTPQSSNTEFYNGNIPFLTISDINDKKYINDTKKHISEKGLKNSNAKIMPKGTLSLAMYASVGKVCILNQNIATSQAFFNMIFDSDFTRNFIYQKLINMNNKKQWSLYILTGTQPNLNAETISTYIVKLPNKEIQQKIAKLLTIIDDKIEYQKNKLSKLQKIKFSMLNIILPKENTNVPKLRFKGFTEDWEQRKLIDVCDYVDYRGKTPPKTDSGIFLVTAKNVKDGYIDYDASQEYISEDDYEETMRRGKPEVGDVLITTEAPCGNVAQVNKENIALAQRIIKYRGHSNLIDNTYLKYYLLSPVFQKILNAKSSGGTVKGIKGSILHQQIIKYPKYDEQIKIGQNLNALDHLITLHQRKCEKLQQIKQALLEKLIP